MKKRGNWKTALKTWWSGQIQLEKKSECDPRIGFAFVELAAENKAKDYYEKACDVYFWALSNAGWIAQPVAILQEAERTIPLLTDDEAQRWRKLIKAKDRRIATDLARFWIEKDPTPSTPLNERLIQHWQRIAHARKNFQKSIKDPYQADDRGVIYVKYGEPDRKKSLFLGNNMTEMMRWSELAYDGNKGQLGGVMYGELRMYMKKFLLQPECEIWLYATLNESENVLFIFGSEEGTGSFRLVNGVEDLIPRNSFRRITTREAGLPAGSLIQLMYYSELVEFDSFFRGRYRELEGIWEIALADAIKASNTLNIPRSFHNITGAIRTRYEKMDRDNPARRYAPPEQSEFADLGSRIQLSTAKVRRLDGRNQPQISFVAFAIPEGISKTTTSVSAPKQYDLTYTLILRDSTMRRMERFSEGAVAGLQNTAVFTIADNPQASHFTVAAEAVARDTLAILGSGQAFYAKDPPLDPDLQKLEVSDLVIGILPPESADFSNFPFPILPSRKIWRGDALQVYFEAYHLKPDFDNAHRFSVEVRVTRLEKKKGKIKRKEMISSTFDFRSATGTAKEFFGVDIEKLKKGDYELAVEVVHKSSSQRKQRMALFEVVEK